MDDVAPGCVATDGSTVGGVAAGAAAAGGEAADDSAAIGSAKNRRMRGEGLQQRKRVGTTHWSGRSGVSL